MGTPRASGSALGFDIGGVSAWQKVAGASALATIVAAFLPWVSIFGISVAGIRGDGKITAGLGVVGVLALVWHNRRAGRSMMWLLIVEGVCAAIVALVALADMNDFAAIGLYLTLLAGLVWSAAVGYGAWEIRQRKRAAPPPPPPPMPPSTSPLPPPSPAPPPSQPAGGPNG